MAKCGSVHPTFSQVTCYLESGNHPDHTGFDGRFRDWPNDSYKPRGEGRKASSQNRKKLKDMATKLRGDVSVTNYRPTEETQKGRVGLYLLKYVGEWIAFDELSHALVAGSTYLSRVRELQHTEHWPIIIDENGKQVKLTTDPMKLAKSAPK